MLLVLSFGSQKESPPTPHPWEWGSINAQTDQLGNLSWDSGI